MKTKTLVILLFVALALSACGQKATLEAQPATEIPTSPAATITPTEIPTATDTPIPTQTPVPSSTPPPPTPTEELPINWDQAINFIGEIKTVCGPVKGSYFATASNGQPTFLNIGKEYPDPARFSIIIWGDDRVNFPEPPELAYLDLTICVTGEIEEYEGLAEIIMEDPAQISLSD